MAQPAFIPVASIVHAIMSLLMIMNLLSIRLIDFLVVATCELVPSEASFYFHINNLVGFVILLFLKLFLLFVLFVLSIMLSRLTCKHVLF